MEPPKLEIVREEADAGGNILSSPDGLYEIHIVCNDLQLKLLILRQLRFFLNDPERSVEFLPKIKDALEREAAANTTIPK